MSIAGALRVRYEKVNALDRQAKGALCRQQPVQLTTDLDRSSYLWLKIQTLRKKLHAGALLVTSTHCTTFLVKRTCPCSCVPFPCYPPVISLLVPCYDFSLKAVYSSVYKAVYSSVYEEMHAICSPASS